MCGIAGIIGRLDEENRAALERMKDTMVHRGPDASGTWVSAPDARGWGTLLAHRRLLLARDPLGIKPLYLARASDPNAGWSVAFASELRALLASNLLGTPRLDPQAVASGVWNGFVAGPGTVVRGIDLLSPGRLIEFDGAGKEIRD